MKSIEAAEGFGSIEGRTFVSRAVIRTIAAGTNKDCVKCEDEVKFNANTKPKMVIANVYEEGVWQRTDFYHAECYEADGEPCGPPFTGAPLLTLEEREQLTKAVGQ